jgi:uncharacterized protein (TIGR00156 family)
MNTMEHPENPRQSKGIFNLQAIMKQIQFMQKILLVSLLTISSIVVYGQFQGEGSKVKLYTVKEILANASRLDRTDALVKVQGYIIKQINADTYEFRDQTGTIQVEISKKRLPERPFNEKTELILIGEVDNDLFQPVEIEVKEIQFVPTKK